MKSLNIPTATTLFLLMTVAGAAAAQDTQPVSGITGQPSRGESQIEIGVAFAQTLSSSTFSATQTVREYAEDATFNSSYKVGSAPGGAFDLQYNLTPKFGVRVGAQTFSRKSTATFDARIPHPFFFSQPRSVSGVQSGLSFREAAYSLTGVLRTGSGKWVLNLEGGPAYFSVNATVADRITFADVYPYDTATFSGIVSSKHKVSPFGFAVGLEIGRQLTPAVSLIAQGRFSQGSGDIDVNGQKINIKAGGAQARIGLRLVLTRKRLGG